LFYIYPHSKETIKWGVKVILLTEKHAEKISDVISCYDRIVIQGTLPGFCYALGMTGFLNANGIRIFDYPRFAEPLRDALRNNAEQIAKTMACR
jgi:hypothetical protein